MVKNKTVGFIGGKFLPLHQGHIYVILEASNKVDELFVVLSSSKNRDKELCEKDGIKYMPAEVRLSWLGEALGNLENIKIVHVEDDAWDNDYDWADGARKIKEAIGKPIDFVFSSEFSYGAHFKKYYPSSKHIVVDDKRKTITISATELRKNLFDNWDKLPASVKSFFAKKVVVVGTESTGKSTLVKKLAKFYNTNYVQEVGREYCEKYSNQLTESMFNLIAMEHYLLQTQKAKESNKLLFVDSDATITQYYLDIYFNGKKSALIEQIIKIQDYDLVIYLEPDVDWVDDGFRFLGSKKERIDHNKKLRKMLKDRNIDFVIIKGDYTKRFNKSRDVIDNLFKRN